MYISSSFNVFFIMIILGGTFGKFHMVFKPTSIASFSVLKTIGILDLSRKVAVIVFILVALKSIFSYNFSVIICAIPTPIALPWVSWFKSKANIFLILGGS